MTSIKAHFDGTSVVLDEPFALQVGQPVRVVVDALPNAETGAPRPSLRGMAKGTFDMSDDFNEPLEAFAEYRR